MVDGLMAGGGLFGLCDRVVMYIALLEGELFCCFVQNVTIPALRVHDEEPSRNKSRWDLIDKRPCQSPVKSPTGRCTAPARLRRGCRDE
jgi:hypothetical protein